MNTSSISSSHFETQDFYDELSETWSATNELCVVEAESFQEDWADFFTDEEVDTAALEPERIKAYYLDFVDSKFSDEGDCLYVHA